MQLGAKRCLNLQRVAIIILLNWEDCTRSLTYSSLIASGALQSTDPAGSSAPPAGAGSEPVAISSSEVPNQSPQPSNPATSQKAAPLNPPSKPRVNPKVPAVAVKPLGGPSSIIQAAAIAAGGRIAPPSTAASHFKAAQSKNAVHIRPGGALPSSSIPAPKAPPPVSIRCTKTPISPKEAATSPLGSKPSTHLGACGSSGQPSPSSDAAAPNQPAEQLQPELSPASPSCADAEGNEEPRSAAAGVDSSDGSPQAENKTPEEIISCDQEDPVKSMDTDSDDKINVDQIGDCKGPAKSPEASDPEMAKAENAGDVAECGDGQAIGGSPAAAAVAADPETAKSEMPFLNTAGKVDGSGDQVDNSEAVAICNEDEMAIDITSGKVDGSGNQVGNSEDVAICNEDGNETARG